MELSGPPPTAMGLALLSAPLSMDSLLPGLYLDFRVVTLSGGPLSLYLHSRCSYLTLLCFLTALDMNSHHGPGVCWSLALYGHGHSRSLSHTQLPWSLCCLNSLTLSGVPLLPVLSKKAPHEPGQTCSWISGRPLKGEAALHSHCSCSHGSQFSHYSLGLYLWNWGLHGLADHFDLGHFRADLELGTPGTSACISVELGTPRTGWSL